MPEAYRLHTICQETYGAEDCRAAREYADETIKVYFKEAAARDNRSIFDGKMDGMCPRPEPNADCLGRD